MNFSNFPQVFSEHDDKPVVNNNGGAQVSDQKTIRTEFTIPAHNVDVLKTKLEKLNRRAVKLGCQPIQFTEIRTFEKKLSRTLESGKTITYMQTFAVVQVIGDSPIVNGWSFVAKVEVTEAGILINAVPGEEVPHRYRDNQSQCEHCKVNARRKRLYIVRSADGSEFKQVGASCLRDFLGHHSPEAIAQWLEALREADVGCGEDDDFGGGWGGGGKMTVFTMDVLEIANSIVRLYGYTTRAESDKARELVEQGLRRDFKDATSSLVWKVLFPPSFTYMGKTDWVAKAKYEEFCAKVKVDDEDKRAAREAAAWMSNINASSDYTNNLKVIGQLEQIEPKRIGIAASGIWAWMKEVQKATKQREALADKSNNHVGEVKARDEYTLILKDVQIKSGTFQDEVALVKFEDEAGNAFVWWTGSVDVQKDGVHWKGAVYQPGVKLKVKATVKKHGEFRGRLTTTLNRCAVLEVLDTPAT